MRSPVRSLAVAIAVLLAAAVSASADRAFLTPALAPPEPSSAVLVLGGGSNRLQVAQRLVAEHYAPYLVVSIYGPNPTCPSSPGVTVICFTPVPLSTQGEAEAFARLARQHHWTSVIVVSGHAQARRARLRVERCFTGPIWVVPARAPASLASRAYDVAYEAISTLKAQLLQRSC